ncbi:hypothetical protein [Mediterraneibacter sp. ICN-202921]|uniref:hypothetical protein n=1 Tax=Mediterraneibacter sp. ICN-202921 TaxID=3134657 RepID=UPI0030C2AB24
MGYLRKDSVMSALEEDRETTLMCYGDAPTRAIVKFCYESMERVLEGLPQYVPENLVKQTEI